MIRLVINDMDKEFRSMLEVDKFVREYVSEKFPNSSIFDFYSTSHHATDSALYCAVFDLYVSDEKLRNIMKFRCSVVILFDKTDKYSVRRFVLELN